VTSASLGLTQTIVQPAGKRSLKVPTHDCTVSNVHSMDVRVNKLHLQ